MPEFISLITAATLNVAIQGEWSYIGQCDVKRHKFTSTSDYFVIKNKKKGWDQIESYKFETENNVVSIGLENTDDIFMLRVDSITPSYIDFCSYEHKTDTWDCDASFYFERCPSR